MRSLVEFVALYWDHADKSTHWPKHRDKEFWGKCAIYVAESSKKVKRTWEAMRSKVIKNLSTKFSTIDEAEEFYKLDYINDSHNGTGGSGQSCYATPAKSPSLCSTAMKYSPYRTLENNSTCAASTINSCLKGYHDLTRKMKFELISTLFTLYVQDICSDPWFIDKFPSDFLKLCIEAVKNLHDQGKDNLIYHTAKCFSLRDNSSQTRLPIGQMPFGLLDYIVKFFSLDMTNNLKCEKDYEEWQVSMYANFGVKWVCMNRGPA